MSLSGLRDISIIETPPEGRRPIRTTVGEIDDQLIKLALEREKAREDSPSISTTASRRSTRLARSSAVRVSGSSSPIARWASAVSEERMHTFLAGDADVLVSTTIIESGIDIPQANTLVVERADALRLAQLYQIVVASGRSDVTAHAYLFYPDASEATFEARARLATLADHTEGSASGSRSRCVTSEIRGAGDLLGAEQSGRRCARLRALRRDAQRGGREPPAKQIVARPVRIDARVDAHASPRRTSRPRRSRSTCTAVSRSLSTTTSCASCAPQPKTGTDRFQAVENLFRLQEARLALALVGADYLVFRAGRAARPGRTGRIEAPHAARDLGHRDLRIGTSGGLAAHRWGLDGALGLAAAIVAARQAA